MNFDQNNFNEIAHGDQKLYFDKSFTFQEFFNHKNKTRKFPFYRNILIFLKDNPNVRIYFTLDDSVKPFQRINKDGFLINMSSYLIFCRTIGMRTGGRLKAFELVQNLVET